MIPLSELETAQLQEIATTSPSPKLRRRAQLVLLAEQQVGVGQIASEVGLSRSRVYHWLREFRQRGLAIMGAGEQGPIANGVQPVKQPQETAGGGVPLATFPPDVTPLTPWDQSVQSILLFHLRETEAWAGELQPALTADRVSALRWHVRAARQLLNTMAPHLDVTDLGEIPRGLRWLAKTSRPLQQSQATVQHLEEYVSSVGEAPSGVLTMLQQWQADRERAQVEVSRALNSRQYRRFVRTVQAFGRKQGAGIFGKSVARQPVRYVLPGLIWGQYQDLRLLEGGIATADARFVRSMRRQVRDLNHNLVGFQAVLGTPGRECSRTAYSAEEQLRWFDGLESAIESARLFLGAAQSGGAAAEGVETFIGAKEAEQARWLEDLSLIWDPVASPQFRTELGLAVAEL